MHNPGPYVKCQGYSQRLTFGLYCNIILNNLKSLLRGHMCTMNTCLVSFIDRLRPFMFSGDGFSSTIGQVSVNIDQGDLTILTSGAIVNSTVDDLNLNSGAISRAILAAAGDSIQNEGTYISCIFTPNINNLE